MDRKNAYKAKPATSVLNREKRQFLDAKQRKNDRKDLLMSKRGLNRPGMDKKPIEGDKDKENKKPKIVKETVGSLHRKKELELWLKDREAKRKAEDKEKRKPFYVGSRNAVASTNPFSVTGHTCCHGTRTTLPSNATQTQDPPMAKKVKPKTKPVLKEPSQPSRRPQTRSQTAKPKKDTNVSRNTRTRTTSNAATATVTKSSRGTGTQGATVTKTTRSTGTQGTTVTKSTRSTGTQGTTVTKSTRSTVTQGITVTKSKSKQHQSTQPRRSAVSTRSNKSAFTENPPAVSKVDLPWVPNSFISRDEEERPDFNSVFGETGTSPFTFGTTTTKPQEGFCFNFTMNVDFSKSVYNPEKSLVTYIRGGVDAGSTPEPFTYSPAPDLMSSPVLSSPEKSSAAQDTTAECVMQELATRTYSTQKALFPSAARTPTTPAPKSTGRYSTRSNLEVSHTATKTPSGALSKKLTLEDDSLDERDSIPGVQACHEQHDQEVERLEAMCVLWEGKSKELMNKITSSENEDLMIDNEILDSIRTTIGQTRLLIKERLKQFKGLCVQAEDPKADKLVTLDDLHAFWDMVYYQIQDVEKKFTALVKLEENDWKKMATVERPKPKRRRGKRAAGAAAKSKRAGGDSCTETTSSSSDSNSNSKREEMRRKLKEMRMEGRRTRSQARAEQDVQIMCSEVAEEMDVKCIVQQTPNKFKSPLPVVRSTRKSSRFDPAELGYDFANYHVPEPERKENNSEGGENAVVDLTFYTTVASTPPPPPPSDNADDTLEFLQGSVPNTPVEDLILFTPVPSGKKRRKSRSSPAALGSRRRRGSIRMYSTITPTQKLLRMKESGIEFDYLMSPVRRSARRTSRRSHLVQQRDIIEVEQLNDLPSGKKVLVVSNPSLANKSP